MPIEEGTVEGSEYRDGKSDRQAIEEEIQDIIGRQSK